MFHILSAIGEFERELINERIKEWLAKAKAKGIKSGRKSKLSPEKLLAFRSEFENQTVGVTKADIARKYGLSVASGYRLSKSWLLQENES
jgi:DNA invertase Pin-like site-specific DNA recombinase